MVRFFVKIILYKIQQLLALDKIVDAEEKLNTDHLERLFNNEIRFINNSQIRQIESEYEKAAWAYYRVLQSILLKRLNKSKVEIKRKLISLDLSF